MWMRVDDKLHSHRKTRRTLRGGSKRRDASFMGVWLLAGSWCADNSPDGWVPEDILESFDDNWETIADQLVTVQFWVREERDGETGYQFNDWSGWNPTGPAESGGYGGHVRWHVNKGIVAPGCKHCPQEPDSPYVAPYIGPMSGHGPDGPSEPARDVITSESSKRAHPETPSQIGIDRPYIGPESLTQTHTQVQPATQVGTGDPPDDAPHTAQALIAEWLENTPDRPPGRVVGHVAREIKTMLDEGQPYDDVRVGLAAWAKKRLHPSTLASVVHETRAPRSPRANGSGDNLAVLEEGRRKRQAAAGLRPNPALIVEGQVVQ